MALINVLLVLALLFFLFLPITDRRTVQMRLAMMCTLLALLSISVARTSAPHTQLAGVVSTR
jgi:hypothetical protein